jgi:hypothetical protein
MMRAIVAEYGDRGIRCNVIAPGGIRSSMWQQRMERMNAFELDQAKWAFSDPLPYHGECEDIANAHLFFASGMSNYITGQHFLVDTGAFIKLHAFPTYDYPDSFPISRRLDYIKRNYHRGKGRDAMDIYDRLGVKKYINAWDTMSVIGGSRMEPATLDAMKEAAQNFIEIKQLHQVLGDSIAQMTQNESAYITAGASAGIMLTCAVCMVTGSGGSAEDYQKVPLNTNELTRNEIVVMKGHRNPYDFAIRVSGARIVEASREMDVRKRNWPLWSTIRRLRLFSLIPITLPGEGSGCPRLSGSHTRKARLSSLTVQPSFHRKKICGITRKNAARMPLCSAVAKDCADRSRAALWSVDAS